MDTNKPVHSQRLERWLGSQRVADLSSSFKDWYGPPITLMDVPGGVKIHGGGDFTGPFERGFFYSAMDSLDDHVRRVRRRLSNKRLYQPNVCNVGFSSLADLISEASTGKRFALNYGNFQKVGTASGAAGGAVTLWYVGSQPAAGAAGAAAPTGTTPTSASTGALIFPNPGGTDTTHLMGGDITSSVAAMALLLYDRLFSVTKTMNSSATEAVTAATTRYNSTTPGAFDYAGGNFLMIECRSVLPATAHNWTTCLYTDESGNTGVTLPSVTGITSCAANRLDMSAGWFCPLASGDTGIRALTQMQCSAAVATGNIDFTMGHPLGIMAFPVANYMFPFDWVTNRDILPRILDNACLALLNLPQSASSATTFSGAFYIAQG